MGTAALKARASRGILLSLAVLAGTVLLGLLGSPPGQAASGKASASTGKMILRIGGLPRGERAAVTIAGPRQSRRSRTRFHRSVSRQGVVRLRGIRAGVYKVKVRRVEIRRAHGAVERGASAFPTRKRLRVKVKRGKATRAEVLYGTIRNPGLKPLTGIVRRVIGSSRNPRAVVLRGKRRYDRGTILSAPPGARFPRGLLAHVTSVRAGERVTRVGLRAASIYEVAPNMSFRTQLEVGSLAGASAFDCGVSGASVDPYANVSNAWVDGSWTTTRVFGRDIKTGARLDLDFDVTAGLSIVTQAQLQCALSIRAFYVQAFPAGIPVYGTVKPTLSGSIGAGARMKAEGKVRVELGARAGFLPPSATPEAGFSSPRFSFTSDVFAEAGLGFALNTEIGIGVDEAANVHATFGNSLDFNARVGSCSWDLKLGRFSMTGKVGGRSISSPSTPPLFSKTLWQSPCGPPPLQAPLPRAEMSWGTDADVDLYAWDEAGRIAYFGERTGIPGAELVEDIIPSEGEAIHPSEVFLEHQSLGRRYTFGVCLYNGVGTDVTLKVTSLPDPRAGDKTFTIPLSQVGDGVVVATSPEGGGHQPPPGWCHSTSAFDLFSADAESTGDGPASAATKAAGSLEK